MLRLHIDFPLGENEEQAIKASKQIIEIIKNSLLQKTLEDTVKGSNDKLEENIKMFQYRLGNDNDRTIKNYLVKDEQGHVTKKKTKVYLVEVDEMEKDALENKVSQI